MPSHDAVLREFTALLAHMGWPVARLATESTPEAAWLALPLPEGAVLLVASVPGPAPDPAASYRSYEDMDPWRLRWIRDFRGRRIAFRYLLLLDGRTAQLLDAEEQLVLAAATGDEERAERLAPLLDPRRAILGVRQSFPRKSPALLAAELRAWLDVWAARIGGRIGAGHETMADLLDALLLDARSRLLGPALLRSTHPGDTAPDVEKRLRLLQETWNLLQHPSWRSLGGALREADRASLLEPCLQSLRLLALPKFTASIYLEALADEPLRHLGWKHAVADTTRLEHGEDWLNEPVIVDLDREGGPIALRRLDQLVARVQEWSAAHASAVERGDRPGWQLDLLSEAPIPPPASEALHFVLRRLLRVRTAQPRRAAVMRLVLAARAAEIAAQAGGLAAPLPTLPVAVSTPAPEPAFLAN